MNINEAICNTKSVYEDSLRKDIEKFKIEFKDIALEEGLDFNNI